MKKIYLSLLLMLSLVGSALAQKTEYPGYDRLPKDSTTHKVAYTAVVQVPGATKDELFVRAKEWLAKSVVDSKEASRMDDKEAGTLVAKTSMEQPASGMLGTPNLYKFTLSVYVKDGRYKYVLDDITRTYTVGSGRSTYGPYTYPVEQYGELRKGKAVDAQIADFHQRMQTVVADLQKAMTASGGAAKSDW